MRGTSFKLKKKKMDFGTKLNTWEKERIYTRRYYQIVQIHKVKESI
jgi:hypothetical protein